MKLNIKKILLAAVVSLMVSLVSCEETAEASSRFSAPKAIKVLGLKDGQVISAAAILTVVVPAEISADVYLVQVNKEEIYLDTLEKSFTINPEDVKYYGVTNYRIKSISKWTDKRNDLTANYNIDFQIDASKPVMPIVVDLQNFFRKDNGEYGNLKTSGYGGKKDTLAAPADWNKNSTPRYKWDNFFKTWNTGTLMKNDKSGNLPKGYKYYNNFDHIPTLSFTVPPGQKAVVKLDGVKINSGHVLTEPGTYNIESVITNTNNDVEVTENYTLVLENITPKPFFGVQGFGYSNIYMELEKRKKNEIGNFISGYPLTPEILGDRPGETVTYLFNKMVDRTTVDNSFPTLTQKEEINKVKFDHGLWRLISTVKTNSTNASLIDTMLTLVDTISVPTNALPINSVANDSISPNSVSPTMNWVVNPAISGLTDSFGNPLYKFEYILNEKKVSKSSSITDAGGYTAVAKVIRSNGKLLSKKVKFAKAPGSGDMIVTGVVNGGIYSGDVKIGLVTTSAFEFEAKFRAALNNSGSPYYVTGNEGTDDSYHKVNIIDGEVTMGGASKFEGNRWHDYGGSYNPYTVDLQYRLVSKTDPNLTSNWILISFSWNSSK
jgi:hypothetical protein